MSVKIYFTNQTQSLTSLFSTIEWLLRIRDSDMPQFDPANWKFESVICKLACLQQIQGHFEGLTFLSFSRLFSFFKCFRCVSFSRIRDLLMDIYYTRGLKHRWTSESWRWRWPAFQASFHKSPILQTFRELKLSEIATGWSLEHLNVFV